jgi:hypothetical protein
MGWQTPRVEPLPALDTSRPTRMRALGFLATVAGALLTGVGAISTWVTVGVVGQPQLDSATKGTDEWDGLVVLACAATALIAMVSTRLVSTGRARRAAAALVTVSGVAAAAVAIAFIATAASRFEPGVVEAIVGGFRTIGNGPWLVIVGAFLTTVGGVAAWRWAARLDPGIAEPIVEDPSAD